MASREISPQGTTTELRNDTARASFGGGWRGPTILALTFMLMHTLQESRKGQGSASMHANHLDLAEMSWCSGVLQGACLVGATERRRPAGTLQSAWIS